MAVSTEFSLPLSLLAVVLDGGWDEGPTSRAAGTLRAAELISRTGPSDLVVALPNTGPENARAVERRIRESVPDARTGIAAFESGDTVESLMDRALADARRP